MSEWGEGGRDGARDCGALDLGLGQNFLQRQGSLSIRVVLGYVCMFVCIVHVAGCDIASGLLFLMVNTL